MEGNDLWRRMKKIRTNPEKITYRACKVTEWGYIRSVDNQDELKKLADNEFDALWAKYRRYHPNKAYWRALTWEFSRRRDEKAAVELAAMADRMKEAPVGNGKPVILREELRRMWREEYAHEAGAADCRAGEDYKSFAKFCKEWAVNFDIR